MSNESELKNPPYPCENCFVLPICLPRDQYTIAMKCDILVDHLVDRFKDALNHFGRCCIKVTPLDKFFEIVYSHERRGIVIRQPSREDGFYNPGRRIVVNPYYPRYKIPMTTLGKVSDSCFKSFAKIAITRSS